jgi:hypothetical protein
VTSLIDESAFGDDSHEPPSSPSVVIWETSMRFSCDSELHLFM